MTQSVPYTIDHRTGRLLLTRIFALDTIEIAKKYCQEMRRASSTYPSGSMVICADNRPVRIFAPEVADEMMQITTDISPKVLRAAVLVEPANALHRLQASRLAKAPGHQERRAFTELLSLVEWLDEVLEPAEQSRLREFLLHP